MDDIKLFKILFYWFNISLTEENTGITVVVLMLNQEYRPVSNGSVNVDTLATLVGKK